MQQVPTYLIIGNGRLPKHLGFYFGQLGIQYSNWFRTSSENLQQKSQKCTHILITISDGSIKSFIEQNIFLHSKVLIHFSGATSVEGAYAFHPLMTFTHDHYDLDFYKTIPFIDFNEEVTFKECFPMLPNTSTKMDKSLMPYYHALCVMGGNFTTLLWAKCSEAFSEIGINSEMIKPYMQKVFENTLSDPLKNLTGPLKRKDSKTIENNLNSLEDIKLKNLYTSFVEISKDMEL